MGVNAIIPFRLPGIVQRQVPMVFPINQWDNSSNHLLGEFQNQLCFSPSLLGDNLRYQRIYDLPPEAFVILMEGFFLW